jgi:hypothetical protein
MKPRRLLPRGAIQSELPVAVELRAAEGDLGEDGRRGAPREVEQGELPEARRWLVPEHHHAAVEQREGALHPAPELQRLDVLRAPGVDVGELEEAHRAGSPRRSA